MYLRELTLVGFKSFADRTRIALEPGVAVIVGPNGSGKSNLVDAIAWVMGTQSPKALRTERMDDVIFAGTAARPALGRAEVSLLFENSDRALPLDLDEVSITRRLYRDGTSQYLIGGVECRLVDVQDLLSDSGVGRRQHTIVSQGQIEAVLSAGPDDHRSIIEEAAGVLKHRARKERAIRRLERSEADVARLRDIERELERQIRPLKRQAAAAARFEEVRAEVRALRLHLDGLQLSRLGSDLAAAEEEDGALARKHAQATAQLERVHETVAAAERRSTELQSRLEADTAAAARLGTSLERFERIAQVAGERLRAQEERSLDVVQRREDLSSERADVVAAAERDREGMQDVSRELAASANEAAALGHEEQLLADQASMPAEGVAATLRGEIASLHRADERDRRELNELEQRLAALSEHGGVDEEERLRLDREIKSLDAQATESAATYARLRGERERLQEAWEQASRSAEAARVEAAAAGAALSVLERAGSHDVDPRVLSAPGVTGAVIDQLEADEDLEGALAAALSTWKAAASLSREDRLEDVIRGLAEQGIRGVTLIPDPGPSPGATRAEQVGAQWGLEPLTERLGGSSDLARSLLGDVLVVESWRAGWEVVSRHPEVRAVTPEGDLVTSAGVALADPERSAPLLLDEAREDVDRAGVELARAESRLKTAARSFEEARSAERESLELLERNEAAVAGATEALDRLDRERGIREHEEGRLRGRASELDSALRDRASQLADLRSKLQQITDESPEERQLRDDALARKREVTEQRLQAEAKKERAGSRLAALTERARLAGDRLAAIDRELGELAEHGTAEASERLGAVRSAAHRAGGIISDHLTVVRERQRLARQDAHGTQAQLAGATEERERLRSDLDEARERRATLAVRMTELRLGVESVAEGLRRDLDATPEDAIAAPAPALEHDNQPHALLEELEARLRRLGPVNPLAAEEHQEVSDRLSFLRKQLEDVETSRRKLRKLIDRLDDEVAERFSEAFAQIASLFSSHFELLFPGGRGSLRLTDPDDLLTTGVEIFAQPMGKRVARLSLLSGGERSLAALAFLFAVFRARPSPFYLLDEVEAALDDANLRRFLRLLDSFRLDAQLIVVTHQTQTMEAADVLYGITLEPGGSTQVLSKRLVAV